MSGGAVDSGRHKLSENIWFVCSKCHIVEIWRDVTLVHTHTDTRNVKKELEFWKQNSQYDSQLNVELRKLKLGKEKGQIDVPQRSELNVRKLANLNFSWLLEILQIKVMVMKTKLDCALFHTKDVPNFRIS